MITKSHIRRITFVLALVLVGGFAVGQASAQTGQTDYWKGFKRTYRIIAGHTAYVVEPKIPLPGKPWVWRASFPDWHAEMDSLLLTKGFYVAYLSVDNQYGSPYATQLWEKFYAYLADSLKLSPRPALEAVSRGALYAIAWAKRNPDKVSCIYSETPVYDMKSWPGGKGKGPGDSASWKQLKDVYHLNEEQALAYDDNPVDHLDGMAGFKIPVMNVIGINDHLAPREENTDVFVKRYTALGGPAAIYPVTDGPQELQGHHFPIKHAALYADFIISNSYPVKRQLPFNDYINLRAGLTNFYKKVAHDKKATVAFLGGSITFNPGWRPMVCAYLKERFPETDFHFIAAGIPSLGSPAHAFRLRQDVLDSGKVDLMFIEAAVNDRVNGVDSITQARSLEGIIRHAHASNPAMDMVLMSFADPSKTGDYDKCLTPVEVALHERMAGYYQLPSINLAKEIHDKLTAGEFSWQDDFKDLHPSAFGEALYFENIKQLLQQAFSELSPNRGTTPHTRLKPINASNFENGSYEDVNHAVRDDGWVYNPNWIPENGQPTRPGFVNVPVLSAEKPGAALTLNFTGDAVGISIVSGDDAGIISYSVDGQASKTLDLYTEWSSSLHLPFYFILNAGLKNGKHVLKITTAADRNPKSKGNACRIVHFLVNK